jgi:hypothetical protein
MLISLPPAKFSSNDKVSLYVRQFGKALEDYSGEGIGKILVFVNVSYADPRDFWASLNLTIDSSGNLLTAPQPLDPAVLASQTGSQLSNHSSTDKTDKTQTNKEKVATSSGNPQLSSNEENSSFKKLNVLEEFLASAKATFQGLVEFVGEVIFRNNVTFIGRATFNKDTAGIAVIQKDSDSVNVVFEQEYPDSPFVSAQIVLDKAGDSEESKKALQDLKQGIFSGDVKYLVTNRSAKGFTIELNKKTPIELQFSWTALSVKDTKKSVSEVKTDKPSQSDDDKEASSSSPITSPIPSPSTAPSPSPDTKEDNSPKIKILDNELGFLRVRNAPNIESEEIGQVKPDQTFSILDSQYGFYQIEYIEGKNGWISSTYTVKE